MVPLRESRKNPHMPHTSPDQCIDDLCRQIQGERDKHKLLKLIDQLGCVLVKEKRMARIVRKQKRRKAPAHIWAEYKKPSPWHPTEEPMERLVSEDLLFCYLP